MNNKTIIKFVFRIIQRIMEISEDFIRQGPNTLGDLHNIRRPLTLCFAGVFFFFLVLGGGEAGRGERMPYILTLQSKNIKMYPLTKFLRLIIQSTQIYHVT